MAETCEAVIAEYDQAKTHWIDDWEETFNRAPNTLAMLKYVLAGSDADFIDAIQKHPQIISVVRTYARCHVLAMTAGLAERALDSRAQGEAKA